MSRDFHELKIAAITAETDAAKTIEFEVPASLAPVFAWRAGQHVTLRFVIDGEEVRRSYSVSASPFSGERLRITVKRVEDGFVSRHVHEQLTEGDTIEVMPPFGGFCLDPDDDLRRTHYFFGAGSGITPLFSMLHSVLLKEPHSVVHLLYGNYSEDNIIFKERLAELGETFSERLSVDHVLSGQSLLSMFKAWRNGVINEETVHELIGERPPYAQDTQYYICGPGNMNQTVRRAAARIVSPSSIWIS